MYLHVLKRQYENIVMQYCTVILYVKRENDASTVHCDKSLDNFRGLPRSAAEPRKYSSYITENKPRKFSSYY